LGLDREAIAAIDDDRGDTLVHGLNKSLEVPVTRFGHQFLAVVESLRVVPEASPVIGWLLMITTVGGLTGWRRFRKVSKQS
jgi:hypothetical protein